jgi:hypothetical protein
VEDDERLLVFSEQLPVAIRLGHMADKNSPDSAIRLVQEGQMTRE